jgi:hypothetical protein
MTIVRKYEFTDQDWALIEPLLPKLERSECQKPRGAPKTVSRGPPVPMMEPTYHGLSYDKSESGLRLSPIRRVTPEPPVRASRVVVVEVFPNHPKEVFLVQRDHMVKTLTPDRPDELLGVGILPGGAQGGRHLGDVHRIEHSGDLGSEDRVVVADQESRRGVERECFAELPGDPDSGRMSRDVEVDDLMPEESVLRNQRGSQQCQSAKHYEYRDHPDKLPMTGFHPCGPISRRTDALQSAAPSRNSSIAVLLSPL